MPHQFNFYYARGPCSQSSYSYMCLFCSVMREKDRERVYLLHGERVVGITILSYSHSLLSLSLAYESVCLCVCVTTTKREDDFQRTCSHTVCVCVCEGRLSAKYPQTHTHTRACTVFFSTYGVIRLIGESLKLHRNVFERSMERVCQVH